MKKKDINLVLEILNDKADEFQQEVNYLRSCNEDLTLLIDNVLFSNLSSDDKDHLRNILVLEQWKNSSEAVDFFEKIESIDCFVTELNEWLKYDNGTCIICELKEDICVSTL